MTRESIKPLNVLVPFVLKSLIYLSGHTTDCPSLYH